MNNEEIEKLKNKMREFQKQDIYIELEEAIQYHITIHSARVIVSDERLIISDTKNQDFIIKLHHLGNVEINESSVCLEMTNDIRITLDY